MTPAAADELRRRAEARLPDQRKGPRSKAGDQKSAADAARLLHELEVHQIELEMQNAELQKARDDLEAALEKYTDLYDFAPVGYLTLDPEGIIREANLAGASLLGIERSALVNRRFELFVSATNLSDFGAFLKKVFASKVRQSCEVTLQVEGRPPLEVELEAIVFASVCACRVTLTDITELRRAEADRLILNKLESTGILAGGIAHDFNNLLTVILLNLELAQMFNTSSSPRGIVGTPSPQAAGSIIPRGEELMDRLEAAKKSVLVARSLTSQFVTLAGGDAPFQRATALSGMIQESVRPALSGSNVRCEFSLAKDLWVAEVDAGQIGLVIRNMVLNAREAMPQGGVVFVRAENVVLSAQDQPSLPAGEYVRVSIADQGAGIAKDVLPKIFDPYFSTKQRGQQRGMGLGLTICHAVVQKHGGAIAVESAVGAGTTFHIYLPASRKLSVEEKVPVPSGVPRHHRILLMDDEEDVRKLVELALRQMGHEVELAGDGQMAVEIYGKAKDLGRPFDMVLLDLMVAGGMGGQEAIQALLQIDPAVKAVVMSGYAKDPVLREHGRYGFKGALAKPFSLQQLQEILSRVMTA
jgi:signal transduction histidine kinase/CheY-like chemotaxis protein